MLLALAIATLPLAQQEIPIQIATSDKGYVATIGDHDATQTPAVVERLKGMAKQRCGALTVRFGKFFYRNGFSPDGKPIVQEFKQNFACIDPATDPYKPVAADWKPAATDDADAKAFANRYLAAIDKGDAAAGMKMMEPIAEITRDEWMDTSTRLRTHSGAPGQGTWTVTLVGWGNNPDGAAHPGAYTLYRVTGTYPKLAAYCGSLLLYRAGPGSYFVSQQQLKVIPQSFVDNGTVAAADVPGLCA